MAQDLDTTLLGSTSSSIISRSDNVPKDSNRLLSKKAPTAFGMGLDGADGMTIAMGQESSNSSPNEPAMIDSDGTRDLPAEVWNMLSLESRSSTMSETEVTDEMADSQRIQERAAHAKPPRSGLVYDVRMRYHSELPMSVENQDYHPEDPRRIYHIYRELCKSGLVQDAAISTGSIVEYPLKKINISAATKEEICLVHDAKHYDFMDAIQEFSDEEIILLQKKFDSIYLNQATFRAAKLSAGGAIALCRAVMRREVKNGMAVIRPPGHHAECNRPMGFCIFDNVSIAAKVCQADFGEKCRKVMIFDWDVHHGNGIQQAFYQDPNVLYVSIHVHQDGKFYPVGPYGNYDHCGGSTGLGKNINVPWSRQGMGDADYIHAFQQIIMPVAYEFDPDLVIIAAGFDAAEGDQLGGCFVTPACYAHMTHMLMSLAGGRVVACLEGGYNLRSISKSAVAVTRTMMGEAPDRLDGSSPTTSGAADVRKVKHYISRFWQCLHPKKLNEKRLALSGADRLHDVVRHYQAAQLFENHHMTELWILHERLSKSFRHQILATPDYSDNVPLMVFFHDPPELIGEPDPVTGEVVSHETWLADGLKHYIDWSVSMGYAVIDVNVPKYLTDIDDQIDDEGESRKLDREQMTNELAVYMWENYIDPYSASDVFFIGVGSAYTGALHLLNTRDAFYQRISGIFCFLGKEEYPIRYLLDQQDWYRPKWYQNNGLLLVDQENEIWKQLTSRKASKRYGTLIPSSSSGLHNMLMNHREAFYSFINTRADKVLNDILESREYGDFEPL